MMRFFFTLALILAGCTTTSIQSNDASESCRSQRVVCRQEFHDIPDIQDFLWRLPGVTIQNGSVFVRGNEALFVIDGKPTASMLGIIGNEVEYVRVLTDPSETSQFTGTSHDVIQIVTRSQ